MTEKLDPEVLAELVMYLGKQRGYASYYDWHDQQVKERGVVSDLLEFVPEDFCDERPSVSSLPEDPPDCVIECDGSCYIGVEVTELVDQAFLEDVVRAQYFGVKTYNWATWDRQKFLTRLRSRIESKAKPGAVFGGPFDDYVLVIHTAEPDLDIHRVSGWLDEAEPISAGVITRGYLLFDYRPGEEQRVARLPLNPSETNS